MKVKDMMIEQPAGKKADLPYIYLLVFFLPLLTYNILIFSTGVGFVKRFCLPADFKTGTIDRYMEINEKRNDSVIFETYGRLTGGVPFGSCRANAQVPEVDIDGLEEYVRYSREKDMEFNYVLDATCMENRELTREGYRN